MNELDQGYSTYAQHDRLNVMEATFTDYFSFFLSNKQYTTQNIDFKLKFNDVTSRHRRNSWVDVYGHFVRDVSLGAHPGEGKTKAGRVRGRRQLNGCICTTYDCEAIACGMTSHGAGDSAFSGQHICSEVCVGEQNSLGRPSRRKGCEILTSAILPCRCHE